MNKVKGYFSDFHPIVWVLLIGTILSRGSAFMTLPFLSIYLSRHLDLPPIIIGLTVGMSPLMATVGGFIGGHLSDCFGRKRVMQFALFSIAFVYFGFTVAKSQGWFILLNALNGLSNSFFEPTSQALMGDVTKKENRIKAYSLRYTAINIGASVGPLIGAYFATTSAKMSFAITGGIYLIYAIVLFLLMKKISITQSEPSIKKSVTFGKAIKIVKTDKALLYLLLGIILVNIGYVQIDSNLPQFLSSTLRNGVYVFSVLLTMNAVMVVFLQMPVSHFVKRFKPMQVMIVGAFFMALGLLLCSFINGWVTAILSMIFLTFGEILIFPSNSLMIDQLAPDHLRGTYFGAGQFRKIGNFLGPVFGGFLLSHYQGQIMFWTISLVVLGSILFFKIGNRRQVNVSVNGYENNF
ncbi:MAG: MDR family MFS transporter [Heyndrickxia sp.]